MQVHSTAPSDVCSVALPLMRFTLLHTLRLHFEYSSRTVLSFSLTALVHLRHFTLGASVRGTLDVNAVLASLTTLTLLHVSSFQMEGRGEFLTALTSLADLSLHKVCMLYCMLCSTASLVHESQSATEMSTASRFMMALIFIVCIQSGNHACLS